MTIQLLTCSIPLIHIESLYNNPDTITSDENILTFYDVSIVAMFTVCYDISVSPYLFSLYKEIYLSCPLLVLILNTLVLWLSGVCFLPDSFGRSYMSNIYQFYYLSNYL
jgi:hypothetical protein